MCFPLFYVFLIIVTAILISYNDNPSVIFTTCIHPIKKSTAFFKKELSHSTFQINLSLSGSSLCSSYYPCLPPPPYSHPTPTLLLYVWRVFPFSYQVYLLCTQKHKSKSCQLFNTCTLSNIICISFYVNIFSFGIIDLKLQIYTCLHAMEYIVNNIWYKGSMMMMMVPI